MRINEMFMSYEDWLNYNHIPNEKYNDPTARMLYNDRWLIYILPAIVIILGIVVFYFTLPELVEGFMRVFK